jgi:hypothetical protein
MIGRRGVRFHDDPVPPSPSLRITSGNGDKLREGDYATSYSALGRLGQNTNTWRSPVPHPSKKSVLLSSPVNATVPDMTRRPDATAGTTMKTDIMPDSRWVDGRERVLLTQRALMDDDDTPRQLFADKAEKRELELRAQVDVRLCTLGVVIYPCRSLSSACHVNLLEFVWRSWIPEGFVLNIHAHRHVHAVYIVHQQHASPVRFVSRQFSVKCVFVVLALAAHRPCLCVLSNPKSCWTQRALACTVCRLRQLQRR